MTKEKFKKVIDVIGLPRLIVFLFFAAIVVTAAVNGIDVASRVSVQLQLTDPAAKSRDRIVKKSEKDGLYTALDFGCVWLERALAGK